MKKIYFTILFAVVLCITGMTQDTESYTALKVTGANVPTIDGTIDAVWDEVELVVLEKVPINAWDEPAPTADDLYSDLGMLWNEAGLFFRFKVVDDITVIFEDYDTSNDIDADQWWVDDHITLMFSKDLINESFLSYEFAWQMGIDKEEKLSSDLWLNAALVDSSLVESAWYNDGTTWILETFIDWECFDDGNATITEGMDIYLEAAVRDDDVEEIGSAAQSSYQWSSDDYSVVFNGLTFGTVTLSGEEVEVGIKEVHSAANWSVYPNPSEGLSELHMNLMSKENVAVSIYNISGKLISKELHMNKPAGKNSIILNLEDLPSGMYFLNVNTTERSEIIKVIKK